MDVGVLGEVGSGVGVLARDSGGVMVACEVRHVWEKWEPLIGEA